MSQCFSLFLNKTVVLSFVSFENVTFLSSRIVVLQNGQNHVNVESCLNGVDVSGNQMFELAELVFEASTLPRVFRRLVMVTLHVEIVNHLFFGVATYFEDVNFFHLFDEVWNVDFI